MCVHVQTNGSAVKELLALVRMQTNGNAGEEPLALARKAASL